MSDYVTDEAGLQEAANIFADLGVICEQGSWLKTWEITLSSIDNRWLK